MRPWCWAEQRGDGHNIPNLVRMSVQQALVETLQDLSLRGITCQNIWGNWLEKLRMGSYDLSFPAEYLNLPSFNSVKRIALSLRRRIVLALLELFFPAFFGRGWILRNSLLPKPLWVGHFFRGRSLKDRCSSLSLSISVFLSVCEESYVFLASQCTYFLKIPGKISRDVCTEGAVCTWHLRYAETDPRNNISFMPKLQRMGTLFVQSWRKQAHCCSISGPSPESDSLIKTACGTGRVYFEETPLSHWARKSCREHWTSWKRGTIIASSEAQNH